MYMKRYKHIKVLKKGRGHSCSNLITQKTLNKKQKANKPLGSSMLSKDVLRSSPSPSMPPQEKREANKNPNGVFGTALH